MLDIDLHTHTLCSDGSLSPGDLVQRAFDAGVRMLSITDHDTLDAYRDLAVPDGMRLVVGVEFSALWQRTGVHIVGLDVNLHSPVLAAAVGEQRERRQQRLLTMASRLRKQGLKVDEQEIVSFAGTNPGRPQIAQFLVETGQVKSVSQAFERYLGNGKPAAVDQVWPDIDAVIGWIQAAEGVAVLAHPLKYDLTRSKLARLMTDFCTAGGAAVEVISGYQKPEQTRDMTRLAQRHELRGSVGSDYHGPQQLWSKLGPLPAFDAALEPVWGAFRSPL